MIGTKNNNLECILGRKVKIIRYFYDNRDTQYFFVNISSLSQEMGVCFQTIRKDLNLLREMDIFKRVHIGKNVVHMLNMKSPYVKLFGEFFDGVDKIK
jgi:NADH/NAD ratio-sensing transcriptional regulator Rex